MADKSLTPNYTDIIDPHPKGDKAVQVVDTLLPYFPEEPAKRLYIAYISSGYTRLEAIKRVRNRADKLGIPQDSIDLELWRNSDPKFLEIDDAGYTELHKNVANLYLELMLRRDMVGILEINSEIIEVIREKLSSGLELTKDERMIYNKAASLYTPENIAKVVKIVRGEDDEDSKPKGQIVDFVALIKGQVRG